MKLPMIFENDPLLTEDHPDEIEGQVETSDKLQKFMLAKDPNQDLEEISLLKQIGVAPPGARNQNLGLQTQKTDMGNNQLLPENMIDIGVAQDRVMAGIQKT